MTDTSPNKKNDGGPAFPSPARKEDQFTGHAYTQYFPVNIGMSLRDYFAAHAVMGWIASYASFTRVPEPETLAKRAYACADAMLVERAKP